MISKPLKVWIAWKSSYENQMKVNKIKFFVYFTVNDFLTEEKNLKSKNILLSARINVFISTLQRSLVKVISNQRITGLTIKENAGKWKTNKYLKVFNGSPTYTKNKFRGH